ncbi:MAG TPA: Mth938-like domain-containing protein, partial [Candidatus Sulfomarinibacteraceae bacterium]|nr:Mth938-like domain-containing protein [Candidatus Sulfomarinibacteraceae bacterium]
VTHISWGKTEVEGAGRFKDVKLFPGGARGWDWNETGTRHRPGVQPADVEELLDHGAEVIILSTGMVRRLQVMPATLQLLEERGVTGYVLPTKKAVARYNELRRTERVGALIHSTC